MNASKDPLVSVICLCYNHERFVGEAIDSILRQTYANLEIIIVDDASTDGSVGEIREALKIHPQIQFLELKENLGNCRAFNQGWAKSTGEYIVDLAADDVLFPERVASQVDMLEHLDQTYGVIFSDAIYLDANGRKLSGHFHGPNPKVSLAKIPSGEIYKELVGMYFIPSPTMMIRRKVLEDLNGYDEELAYEDFDFWVRSSRKYKYQYQDQILTGIRRIRGSMSDNQYREEDHQLKSTYRVCQKIRGLNRTKDEDEALARRLKYEFRHSLIYGQLRESRLFYSLYKEVASTGLTWRIMNLAGPLLASLGIHRLLKR